MNSHICPACQTQQDVGDGFCIDCGTQLIPIRYCERCGVTVDHTGEFCRECGGRLPVLPAPALDDDGPEPSRPTPQWMKEPDPPPAKQEPEETGTLPRWMRDPVAHPKQSRPAKLPAKPKPTPTPQKAAPIQRRPTASPVPIRRDLPVPYQPSTTDNARALVAGTAGLLSIVTASGSLPLSIVLLFVMLGLGGKRLRYGAAGVVNRVVDWLWEDPVLRHRLLGE